MQVSNAFWSQIIMTVEAVNMDIKWCGMQTKKAHTVTAITPVDFARGNYYNLKYMHANMRLSLKIKRTTDNSASRDFI